MALRHADGAVLHAVPGGGDARVHRRATRCSRGSGMYSFLRIERLARLAATLGGLSLAMLDVDLGDRDLDAVRGRDRVDDGGAGGRGRLPARRRAGRAGSRGSRSVRSRGRRSPTAHLSHGLGDVHAAGGRVPRRARGPVVAGRGRTRSCRRPRAGVPGGPPARSSLAVLMPRMRRSQASSLPRGTTRSATPRHAGRRRCARSRPTACGLGGRSPSASTPGAYAGAVDPARRAARAGAAARRRRSCGRSGRGGLTSRTCYARRRW